MGNQQQAAECLLCTRIISCQQNSYPLLVKEFTTAYLVLGEHQFYPGYSVLYLKHHAVEMHQLAATIQQTLLNELMQAATAIYKAFSPLKLNYACYGNQVEHLHWHIIPRYASDPQHKQGPFVNSQQFAQFPSIPELAQPIIARLQSYLT